MQLLNLVCEPAADPLYSHILRCIGDDLQDLDLKAFELKCEDDFYLFQGWPKGTAISVGIERRYTIDDLIRVENELRKRRQPSSPRANPLNLSQLLRTAGNYVDFVGGHLIRIEWQRQSEKVQSITLQYRTAETEDNGKDFSLGAIEEICVHIYKERKKMRALSVRPAPVDAA